MSYSEIINGADLGDKELNINASNSSTTPFDDSVSLCVDYDNTASNFGGFLFDFSGDL